MPGITLAVNGKHFVKSLFSNIFSDIDNTTFVRILLENLPGVPRALFNMTLLTSTKPCDSVAYYLFLNGRSTLNNFEIFFFSFINTLRSSLFT